MASLFSHSNNSTPLDPEAPPIPGAQCRLVYAVNFDKFRHIDFATRDDALDYLASHNPLTSRSTPGVLVRIQTLNPPPAPPAIGTAPEWLRGSREPSCC
jgi:hypothetical protein